MNVFVALLAAYGLCFGLANDKVKWLTDLLKRVPLFPDERGLTYFDRMFTCSYCTGFHTGWMIWGVSMLPTEVLAGTLDWSHAGEAFAFAFASSAFCYGMDTIIEWFERER